MKRVQDVAWPVIGLAAVAVSSWLLFKELRGLSLASLRNAFASISLVRWLAAIVSTSLAYTALAWYDQIALRHLGRRLSWRFVGLVSFTAYAIAHNIGASVLSGAVIRYRAYSTKGLSVGEDRRPGRFLLVHLRPRGGDARRPPAARPPRAGRAPPRRAAVARRGGRARPDRGAGSSM